MSALPCPFCGKKPKVMPTNPKLDGDAWARVKCTYKRCYAQPEVTVHKARAPKAEAIRLWNKRKVVEPIKLHTGA
jgi:hypothetical protein